ncbi:hypothetical protein JCM19297_1373 [Nonlabens ulvanivorans]|nr:hypothetical protein JCM19297_1373 [Nonlabens ulvanivorans]
MYWFNYNHKFAVRCQSIFIRTYEGAFSTYEDFKNLNLNQEISINDNRL